VERLTRLREEIASLTRDERIEFARWVIDNVPECCAAMDERRPTLVDVSRNGLLSSRITHDAVR